MKKMTHRCSVLLAVLTALSVSLLLPGKAWGAEADYAGEYTMFAMSSDGITIGTEDLGSSSVLILNEDGTAHMTMDDEETDLERWSVEGETLTLEVDGSTAEGIIQDGVIELDFSGTGEYIALYAREGADISAYEVMTLEEAMAVMAAEENASGTSEPASDSLVAAAYSRIDVAAGAHLNYQADLDYMESTQTVDVHAKGGTYYASTTTEVSGFDNTNISFFQDGEMMMLDPEAKTATIVTSTTAAIFKDNALILDNLYSELQTASKQTEYTTETREVDGKSYQVEVYPATSEYTQEWAFYFDEEGNLKYAQQGAIKTENMDLGEIFFTVNSIDGEVDESLFDISDYEKTELDLSAGS